MEITVNIAAAEAVYEQIVRQIHEAVKSGTLRPDTPLPTVRQLAGDLMVNRNTVARAYRILEDQGVIQTAGRKGTFVRQNARHAIAPISLSAQVDSQPAVARPCAPGPVSQFAPSCDRLRRPSGRCSLIIESPCGIDASAARVCSSR